MDDRHAGKVSDARQTIGTAVAIAEASGLGLARGAPRAFDRGADVVSRYGIGTSLAQLPAALLAPFADRRLGPGASQPLFLLAPFAAVLLAAAAAGRVARLAGGSEAAQAGAVVLATLGSPLGAYASSDFSEPLQAAALAGSLALALGSARGRYARSAVLLAAGAGAAAGAALLVKSSLAAAAPFLLLPLAAAGAGRGRRLLAAAAGFAAPFVAWLAFELVRFGRPFGGYAGEGFTHPLADGAWRLLVGPNRGLLLFFPAAALAAAGAARALRRGDGPSRLAAAGSLAGALVLLVTAATWWAWHGVGGWGPRLLVPAVPLLAPWAGLAAEGLADGTRRLLLAASILLNVPPLLVHPALVDTYVANCRRAPVAPGSLGRRPAVAIEPDEAGRPSLSPDDALATVPAAAPHVVYPWYFLASASGPPEEVAARLARPPWYERHPELGPRLVPFPPELATVLAPPPRWSFLGRSFLPGAPDPARGSVYLDSLRDQVLLAQEAARSDRGLAFAEKLATLRPDAAGRALVFESLRLLGRRDTARAFVRGMPPEDLSSPEILAVAALLARDEDDPGRARTLAAKAAPFFPGSALAKDPARPGAWPASFAALVRPAAASAGAGAR